MEEEKTTLAEQPSNAASDIISRTSGLQGKDYFGYALGDFAGCMAFATVTTLLQRFYTDVWGLSPLFILFMFMFARIWDAINDPIMGRIVDIRRSGKGGRYKVWMKIVAIPLALSTVLMFLPWPTLAETFGQTGMMVYAAITYVLFGMIYTMHQIPYGSLASVVTTDVKERNKLSVFRSIGAALGNIPILAITFIWTIGGEKGADGKAKVNYFPVIIGIAIVAVLIAALLFLAYKLNKERVVAKPKTEKAPKGEFVRIAKNLLTNKSFLAVSLAGMLLLAGQMFTQSFYTYLFSYKFGAYATVEGVQVWKGQDWMSTVSMVCTYLPMVILMPFMGKLVQKFGKKAICAAGAFLAAAANLILFGIGFLGLPNMVLTILFLLFCFISGFGLSIITLEVWALATDAIDDVEVKTGMRNDGSSYSIFMFFRKFGQVIAAVAVNGALLGIQYLNDDGSINSIAITENVDMFYILATIIPAAMFGLMGLVMLLLYSLSKKKTEELQTAKAEMLAAQVANNEISVGGEEA
ncbi:MAG: glycoside-pentoside-hexuronide (GPH):cation symporter [Bacilli bacterium]|nr:glycoside-pentoside-hexuronide (GPH):cation symporter [Bacilli bacterium]